MDAVAGVCQEVIQGRHVRGKYRHQQEVSISEARPQALHAQGNPSVLGVTLSPYDGKSNAKENGKYTGKSGNIEFFEELGPKIRGKQHLLEPLQLKPAGSTIRLAGKT